MANVPTTSWSELTPAGSDQINAGDNRIRELKTQIREVIDVDHDFPSSGQAADVGQHKKVTLQEQADLGTGAVGATILGSQTISTKGELVYTDEDDNDIQITSGGKIKLSSGRLENNTNITSRNAGGDGDINVIKVNADDVVELPDASVLATSAAPTLDNEIANKKYVDDRSLFGTAETGKSLTTVYQATSDGWVHVTANGGSDGAYLVLYADSSNPPTTIRGGTTSRGVSASAILSINTMVKKDQYYKVIEGAGVGASNVVYEFWPKFGA